MNLYRETSNRTRNFRCAKQVQEKLPCHLFSIQQIAEKVQVQNREVYLCFFRINKAFNIIKREEFWNSSHRKWVQRELAESHPGIQRTKQGQTIDSPDSIKLMIEFNNEFLVFVNTIDNIFREFRSRMKKYCEGWSNLQLVQPKIIIRVFQRIYAEHKEKKTWNEEASK